MRVLISNDDGINANGIKVLEKIALQLTDDVWVVAPEVEHSGAGHSLTLMRPLRVRKVSRHRVAVDGTPTDCMQVALKKLLAENKPDLMLSGINHGANIGEDITYSGTIAAAMEATLLGIPSIALSQLTKSEQPVKWGTAEPWAPKVIKKLLKTKWPKDVLINLNFPNVIKDSVSGIEVVRHGSRHEKGEITLWHDPRGIPFYWLASSIRGELTDEIDTDLSRISEGYITITPLHLDLTHYDTLDSLKKVFSK